MPKAKKESQRLPLRLVAKLNTAIVMAKVGRILVNIGVNMLNKSMTMVGIPTIPKATGQDFLVGVDIVKRYTDPVN